MALADRGVSVARIVVSTCRATANRISPGEKTWRDFGDFPAPVKAGLHARGPSQHRLAGIVPSESQPWSYREVGRLSPWMALGASMEQMRSLRGR